MRFATSFAPVMRRCALAVLLLAAPATARAQSTSEQIAQAILLYEAFNVEQARPILLKIISPGYLQQVSSTEKATALKYLGASYAVLASPDSARNFFIAALDFDPFTDLDPTKFAASELGAFNEAKARIFKVAIRSLPGPSLVQRDSADVKFEFITTQRGNLHVELINQTDTTLRQVLLDNPHEGKRTIPWRGVLSDGRYAPPGIYVLRARATPSSGGQTLTESMSLRIEHVVEPLEDTLRALDPVRELLPERIPQFAPWKDLIKGGVLAGAAIGLPLLALNSTKDQLAWTPHAGAAAAVGAISGGISFYYRRRNPQIPQNVDENARRQRVRAAFNAAVRQRNLARIDRTLLIVSPVTTFGQ